MKTFSILLFALLFNCNTIKEKQVKKSIPLEGTTWLWQYTEKNSQKTYPKKKEAFSITFYGDRLAISTDCNTMGGSFTQNGEVFEMGMMMATKMYCPDSQESLFGGMLSQSKKITWNEKELQLSSEESGTMYFVKK
jgi:heat shock protein HslJ